MITYTGNNVISKQTKWKKLSISDRHNKRKEHVLDAQHTFTSSRYWRRPLKWNSICRRRRHRGQIEPNKSSLQANGIFHARTVRFSSTAQKYTTHQPKMYTFWRNFLPLFLYSWVWGHPVSSWLNQWRFSSVGGEIPAGMNGAEKKENSIQYTRDNVHNASSPQWALFGIVGQIFKIMVIKLF